jgi:DNA (cytosine-5)-methyltransferase 1
MGLFLAGFHVTGVDIRPQPRYPFNFVQADAIEVDLAGYDFVWASPPCQAHTSLKSMHNAKPHLDLIPATRERLKASGIPYVIENVPGAPLINPFLLCGTMFKLVCSGAELRRHRIFEASFPVQAQKCQHGMYPATIGIHGEGCRDSRRKFDKTIPEFTVKHGREAMGIDWMSLAELCQAIPPAYSRYIAQQSS